MDAILFLHFTTLPASCYVLLLVLSYPIVWKYLLQV